MAKGLFHLLVTGVVVLTAVSLLAQVVRRFEMFEAAGAESVRLSLAPLLITRHIPFLQEVLT
ncbi:hypothetical protein [Streptomyces edwardsiae]|uniref:Uncharacterized protein n=1 Tax=Streptomyces edwardsiae TaxID=3075527 RepID=A0ABU2Q4B3_9ACTN|nr:hypothetical protein [Streptomyces sp. DSM 41636]MDT0399272.1 hypothetical protein [Streptomyces sp. DSM 41636]